MKRIKWVVIGLAVIAIAFAVLLSCENGVKDPSSEDIQKFIDAMIVFDSVDPYYTPGVSVSGDPYTGMTMTFTNVDIGGVILNGSATYTVDYSGIPFTITISGTINFTGTNPPVSSIAFNSLVMSIDPYDPNFPDSGFSISGTISIDGTEFNASGFLDAIYDYIY